MKMSVKRYKKTFVKRYTTQIPFNACAAKTSVLGFSKRWLMMPLMHRRHSDAKKAFRHLTNAKCIRECAMKKEQVECRGCCRSSALLSSGATSCDRTWVCRVTVVEEKSGLLCIKRERHIAREQMVMIVSQKGKVPKCLCNRSLRKKRQWNASQLLCTLFQ